MERHAPTLIERHCEKLCLATAVSLAGWLGWAYVAHTPNTVEHAGRRLGPGELNSVILCEARALEQHGPVVAPAPVEIPPLHRQLRRAQREGIYAHDVDAGGPSLPHKLPLATMFGRGHDIPLALGDPVEMVTPLAPFDVRATTGLALLPPLAESSDAARVQSWVHVTACYDSEAQRVALEAAGYPRYASRVHIAAVEAQRQQLCPDDTWLEWRDIRRPEEEIVALPAAAFDDDTGRVLNRAALNEAYAAVKAAREALCRPPFGEVLAGSAPSAERTETGVFADVPVSSIWIHDRDAEPGRTYRYRVRVRLWNRFVGRPRAVVNAADARATTIAGHWSEPTPPITAAPRRHVFLIGPARADDAAMVEVWKWRGGQWLRKTFAVAAGDTIGAVRSVRTDRRDEKGRPVREQVDFGTGISVLDVRAAGPAMTLVCHDPVTGRVVERSQHADLANPLRKTLRQPAAKSAPAEKKPAPRRPGPPDRRRP